MKKRTLITEIAIIGVIGVVFFNSARKFLTESDVQKPVDQKIDRRTAEYPFAKPVEKDDSTGFFQYKTNCEHKGETVTTYAPRVRITGHYCGYIKNKRKPSSIPNDSNQGKSGFKIFNESSNYTATVFSDESRKTFSTDFIPLEQGINKITMNFAYNDGNTYPVEVTVIRKKPFK